MFPVVPEDMQIPRDHSPSTMMNRHTVNPGFQQTLGYNIPPRPHLSTPYPQMNPPWLLNSSNPLITSTNVQSAYLNHPESLLLPSSSIPTTNTVTTAARESVTSHPNSTPKLQNQKSLLDQNMGEEHDYHHPLMMYRPKKEDPLFDLQDFLYR